MQYSSFDEVIDMIATLGICSLLGKDDIKRASCSIPFIHGDFDLLGLSLDGLYYIYKCLPMGCSISCKIWEVFATSLHGWKALKLNYYCRSLFRWLKFARSSATQDCAVIMSKSISFADYMGIH